MEKGNKETLIEWGDDLYLKQKQKNSDAFPLFLNLE